jgi:hypothetical protein
MLCMNGRRLARCGRFCEQPNASTSFLFFLRSVLPWSLVLTGRFQMKISHTLACIATITLAGAATATAASSGMRPATRDEIVRHLGPNAAGTAKPNGFTYKAGSSKGYKVSNGQICIRSPQGTTQCASIVTNGTTFQMIAKDGARSTF